MTTSAPCTPLPNSDRQVVRRKRSSFSDIIKIVVVGDKEVGKSAIVVRLLTKRYIGEYDHTTDNKYRRGYNLDGGETAQVEIVDPLCPEASTQIRDELLRWGDGYLLVYDVNDADTFSYLQETKNRLLEVKKGLPILALVIGNKTDNDPSRRQVTSQAGEEFANTNGFMFCEASAKESPINVLHDAFTELCRETNAYRRRSKHFLDRVFGFSNLKNKQQPQ